MDTAKNACAGPFGAIYDVYTERPWLMKAVCRVVWGIDASVLYSSMQPITEIGDGSTIIDVPCGGGVALRALRPEQKVRYLAGDLSQEMLRRTRRRAFARGLEQVEVVSADMTVLPFDDASADLFLSYSGLHMVDDPRGAIDEISRCLRPGAKVIGTTFLSDVSRRAKALFAAGNRTGHALPPHRRDLESWLRSADLVDVDVGTQSGFVVFSARKVAGGSRAS